MPQGTPFRDGRPCGISRYALSRGGAGLGVPGAVPPDFNPAAPANGGREWR
ncbi:hypothetical protein C357_01430 [Citreicella sp. 357]|nr:hypothetical protein C357_01430 [Citreicella sp. 357]